MSTTKLPVGARTALTTTALNSLGSATFVNAGTINVSASDPHDVLVEVFGTPGTVSGSKQLLVFLKISLDGTNYSSGPESGTTATDQLNLILLGSIPMLSNATQQSQIFSIRSVLGFLPPHSKVIVKNETGAALAASGHGVYYAEVSIETTA